MVKHTQTIRRPIADELFECVWPFCEISAWRVKLYFVQGRVYYVFELSYVWVKLY